MGVRNDGILQVDDVGGGGVSTPVEITTPIGQQTMANSVGVTIASDQSPIRTRPGYDFILSSILDDSQINFVTINFEDGSDPNTTPASWVIVTIFNLNPSPLQNLIFNTIYRDGSSQQTFVPAFKMEDGTYFSTDTDIKAYVDVNLVSRFLINVFGVATFQIGIKPAVGFTAQILMDTQNTDTIPLSVLRSGAKGSSTTKEITSTASGANHQALDTILYDSAGNPLFPTPAALADNTPNPTVSGVGAFGMVWDGLNWHRQTGFADGTFVTTIQFQNSVIPAGASVFGIGLKDVDFGNTYQFISGRRSAPASADIGVVTRQVGLPDATALADNTSNPTLTQIQTFPSWFDGATWDRARGTSTDGLLVNLGANNDVITSEVKSATSAQTTVNDSASSVTILAANANRLGATITNTSSATLRARLSATAATLTNYTVPIVSGAYYEVPFGYTGAITGIWDTDPGDGAALVTELT